MSLDVASKTLWYGFLVTWPTIENSKASSALEFLTVKHVHIILLHVVIFFHVYKMMMLYM